jgi:hypothetical protein
VAKGGGLRAQKRSEPIPISSSPTITCLYNILSKSTTWPPPEHLILLIPQEKVINENRAGG